MAPVLFDFLCCVVVVVSTPAAVLVGDELEVVMVEEKIDDDVLVIVSGSVNVVEGVVVVGVVSGSGVGVLLGVVIGVVVVVSAVDVVQDDPNSVTIFVTGMFIGTVTGTVTRDVFPDIRIQKISHEIQLPNKKYAPGSVNNVVASRKTHVVEFVTVVGTHVRMTAVPTDPGKVVIDTVVVVEKLSDVDTSVLVAVGVGVHAVAMFLTDMTSFEKQDQNNH